MSKRFKIGESITGGILDVIEIKSNDETSLLSLEFKDWDTKELVYGKTFNNLQYSNMKDFMYDNMDDYHIEQVLKYINELKFFDK